MRYSKIVCYCACRGDFKIFSCFTSILEEKCFCLDFEWKFATQLATNWIPLLFESSMANGIYKKADSNDFLYFSLQNEPQTCIFKALKAFSLCRFSFRMVLLKLSCFHRVSLNQKEMVACRCLPADDILSHGKH